MTDVKLIDAGREGRRQERNFAADMGLFLRIMLVAQMSGMKSTADGAHTGLISTLPLLH